MCGPLLQPVSQDDERIILTTQIRGKGSLCDTKLAAIKDFIKGADFKAAERVLLGAYAYPRSELFAAAERKLKTLFNSQAKEKRQALSDGQGKKRIRPPPPPEPAVTPAMLKCVICLDLASEDV